MKPVIIINSFKTVVFNERKRPLVICDIDDTFLRPSEDPSYYYDLCKSDMIPSFEIDYVAKDMIRTAMSMGFIKQTDLEGFNIMLKHINRLNGKLIFLTARGSLYHEKTLRDLSICGLQNPEKYKIYYTNNQITKGEFIKKYNLLNGYEHISFIDDIPDVIQSVINIYPNINCYLFKYK